MGKVRISIPIESLGFPYLVCKKNAYFMRNQLTKYAARTDLFIRRPCPKSHWHYTGHFSSYDNTHSELI